MSEDREREDSGFTVRDRRIFSQSESEGASTGPRPPAGAGEAASAADPAPEGGPTGQEQADARREADAAARKAPSPPLPEIDFATFVISLSTSAMYHLGAIQDPESGKAEVNLPLAKQTIDILGMLKQKTEGNCTPDETRLLDGLLYDLRLRYVDALRK